MAEERAFHIIKRRERNSMNRQTILLISDMRQVYLAEIMTKRDSTYAAWISETVGR